ncbi:MAG: aminotransferase class I/II-fold pyridoxal phosphate-dependent enzyme, partial [Mesorhizobium sp.]
VIAAAKTPFNVNAAAQTAAIAALADESWMKASASRVRAERVRTATALVGLGFRVAPSQTNFLFFDCKGDSSSLAADLLKQGIIVKAWREAGYERYLRATIGLPADNDRLIAALQELVGR